MANDINTFDFREHFEGGDNSGQSQGGAPAGMAGWNYDQLQFEAVLGEENHPGIIRFFAQGQGVGNPIFSRLVNGNNDSKGIHMSNVTRWRAILRFSEPNGDGDFTDEGIYVGFGASSNTFTGSANLGSNCVFFSFRAGVSPKWQATCQAVDLNLGELFTTITDSGGTDVALDTWYVLEAVQTANVWEFFVNGVSFGTIDTNVPLVALTPQFRIRTEGVHETGYVVNCDADEFAYRWTSTSPLPGIVW